MPDAGWRDLGAIDRARYFSVVAALPLAFERLGLSLHRSVEIATSAAAVSRHAELSPAELETVAADIARALDVRWLDPVATPVDVLTRQPFVDLADRLPALLALAGEVLIRTTPSVATIDAAAIEAIARATHQHYVARAIAAGESPDSNSSLVPWEQLPERLTEANREQARDICNKVAMLGVDTVAEASFPQDGPLLEALAEVEHRRWSRAMRDRGYSYAIGPKDDEARTHPDLVAYGALAGLPDDPQAKDRESVRDIPTLLSDAGVRLADLLSR